MIGVACSQQTTESKESDSTIDQILNRKKLVIGTSAGYFPFHMRDKKGEHIGYDIDTAKAIAEVLNVEIEFRYFSFDGLIFLPQAIRTVLPAIASQYITFIKDSSLVSVISVVDLTLMAKNVVATSFRSIEIWTFVAIIYFSSLLSYKD